MLAEVRKSPTATGTCQALFVLNLLAFFMHQIFELVDGLYQRVRTFFSSRRAFWDGCGPPSGCSCLPPGTRCWCA